MKGEKVEFRTYPKLTWWQSFLWLVFRATIERVWGRRSYWFHWDQWHLSCLRRNFTKTSIGTGNVGKPYSIVAFFRPYIYGTNEEFKGSYRIGYVIDESMPKPERYKICSVVLMGEVGILLPPNTNKKEYFIDTIDDPREVKLEWISTFKRGLFDNFDEDVIII